MRKLLSLLPILLLVLGFQSGVQAQTAEEIVSNYLEAIGGAEKLASIKTLKTTMKGKSQGMDLPITMLQAAPNKMRMDLTFQGQTMTQMAFDGQTGWGVNFMNMETEKWDAEQSAIMKEEVSFPDPFLDYKSKGHTVSLEGEEEIDGTPCYKIKLTKSPVVIDGEEEENFSLYFFDKENNVPIMQKEYAKTGQMKGAETDTYLSDYQEVDGIYFAHSVEQKVQGQTAFSMVIEKIEINPTDVNDDSFAFPGDKLSAEEKLEQAVKATKEDAKQETGKTKADKKKKKEKK